MTTSQRILSVVCLAVGVILAVLVSWFISGNRSYHKGWDDALAGIKPDTVYRDTTIYKDNPVPVEVKPAGKEMYPVGTVAELKRIIDSLAAVKPDTTLIEVPVPMETKLYRDEVDSTYEAQVSGYHPTLDWIKVNQKTAYITKVVTDYKYPQFMVSPAVSVEILPRSIFAGAGLVADYWTGRFQISVEAGYGINNILGTSAIPGTDTYKGESATGVYGILQAKFNLIRK